MPETKTTKPKTLAAKMLAVAGEIGRVGKDGHNDFHNYDYTSEAAVVNEVSAACVKHGVMVVPTVSHSWQEKRTVQTDRGEKTNIHTFVNMAMRFIDVENGDSIETSWIGEGQDSGDKGYYKAYTGAQKYALLKTFMIATGDDPEADEKPAERAAPEKRKPGPGPISEKQLAFLHTLAADLGWEEKEKLALKLKYKVASTKDLTKAQASEIIEVLKRELDAKVIAAETEANYVDEGPEIEGGSTNDPSVAG